MSRPAPSLLAEITDDLIPLSSPIFDFANMMIVLTDDNHQVLDCTSAVPEFFQTSKENLLDANFLSLTDDGDRNFIQQLLDRLKAGEKSQLQLEKRLLIGNDRIERWIKITCGLYNRSKGRIVYCIDDITDYKLSLIQRRQSDKHWNNSLMALSDAYLMFDGSGHLIHFSSGIHSVFPETRHALMPGAHISEISSKIVYSNNIIEAVDNELNYLQEWQAHFTDSSYKFFFRHRNKKYFLVQQSSSGEHTVITFIDITQIREQESLLATLAAENSQLSEAVQATNTGMAICDARLPDNPIIFANRAFSAITGHSPDKVIGQNLRILYGPDSDAANIQKIESGFEHYTAVQVEVKTIDSSKRSFWSHIQLNPIVSSDGVQTHFVVILTDITQRKIQEQEVIHSKNAADEASKVKSQFLAVMSHEMKTPLNGMMGMVDLLSQTNLTAKQVEFLDTAKESTEKLLTLIDDILDYSNLESKTLAINTKSLDLNDLIRRSLGDLRDAAFEKGLSLQFTLDYKIPKQLYGNADRIAQITRNIVSNAIKFTAKGQIEVQLNLLSETTEEAKVQVKVADTGIGIAPDKLTSIFEPFQQVDLSFTRKFSGTGLGLAICKKLVGLMNGDISVTSKPNQGSTFVFTMVLSKAGRDHAVRNSGLDTFASKRILVVDDSLTNRLMPVGYLKHYGFQVDQADDGKVAVQMAEKTKYDLILMDIKMPKMDGITAATKIKSMNDHYKTVPIISITAHPLPAEKEKCRAAGMIGYLIKPVEKNLFLKTIFDALNPSSTSENKGETMLVDESVLKQLRQDIGEDTLNSLLDTFIDETVTRLSLIKKLCQEEKWDNLEREGHTLKSTCGSFGLMPLCGKAKELDESCRQKNYSQAKTISAEIENFGNESIEILRRWMQSPGA